jgi:predicted DNA binding protein
VRVYVVTGDVECQDCNGFVYGGGRVVGVFSSKEKAEEVAAAFYNHHRPWELFSYDVVEVRMKVYVVTVSYECDQSGCGGYNNTYLMGVYSSEAEAEAEAVAVKVATTGARSSVEEFEVG